jgi:hypothetical protein
MTPAAILSRAESMGLTITPDGENIRVRGPREAIAEITPLLKLHKPAIIAAMNMPANEPESSCSNLKADDLGKGGHPLSSALQSTSTLEFENLIQRAATFYEYSPDDFALIDEMRRTDQEGLRLALETDRLRFFYTKKEPT